MHTANHQKFAYNDYNNTNNNNHHNNNNNNNINININYFSALMLFVWFNDYLQ